MPLRLIIRNWRHRLISWIKESDYKSETKLNLIKLIKKYKQIIPNYERAKKLHEKQKTDAITDKEGKELTARKKNSINIENKK